MIKTGVIGLGAMGAHMARNLHANDLLAAVWNRSRDKAESLAGETGCQVADSPAQLAELCDVIITCVSRDDDVLDVVDQLLPGIQPGGVVADTSTVNASTAQTAAARLADAGGFFLDCPVSGGVEGARQGTLVTMVGGDVQALERARPALEAIAGNVIYMGESGSGQATKAVNQLMAAGINQAVTEALAFGESLGLDMDKVVDVVSAGAAGNWFVEHRGKTMLKGVFDPGFKLGLHHKDLGICRSMALEKTGISLPLVEMTLIHYQKLMDEGHADEDISALFRLKQRQHLEGPK
ncbi:3-hydroxyisobutyrate dehydrogenase [Methylohalomonas lacus]|uniref:3-hydroxyisobutyrate dehydrogenase n=1 Tax=Methylohalomonas lacus TaxID=398773 RepID=A0AAE3L130_9GAMM|nr:3-hydroxyisobutyrate dehydrogenase [Methylohalomonas lacus]